MDIRDRLLAAFEAERRDHLDQIRAQLSRFRETGQADIRELLRRAHSLKGAARAVDRADVEEEAHALESLLELIQGGRALLEPATTVRIERALDRIEGTPSDDAAPVHPSETVVRVRHDRVAALAAASASVGEAFDIVGAQADVERLAAGLDALLGEAGVAEHPSTMRRLAEQARQLRGIARRLGEGDASLARALDRVEHEARDLMLAPAAELTGGLAGMVRDLADEAGVRARLVVRGEEVEADRRSLEPLRDPVIHLLRNAIAHGVEPAPDRLGSGKPAEALLEIAFTLERGDLAVTVRDDGRGLDRAAVAAATGGDAAAPDAELFARLFEQGVSTADAVDRVAGRGVGLAIVAEAARALGGSARIAPGADGIGTVATIRVPRSAVRQPVLELSAGGHRVAVPAHATARVTRVEQAWIEHGGGGLVARLPDQPLPVRVARLSAVLGGGTADADPRPPALLLEESGERLLLLVDEVLGVSTVLVRPATEIALAPPAVAGAFVAADGAVVPLLHPPALLAASGRGGVQPTRIEAAAPRAAATILVVDDSITARTLQRSILEAQGYRVEVAVDGLTALDRLRGDAGLVKAAIVDVEMPRLDGFGLLSAMRNDPLLANIPVIMMTSRNSADDVRRGLDLGASAYLVKQAFDAGELLAAVARFV